MNAPKPALALNLRENALDSLQTGIDYYFDSKKATAWKYAIMLTAHSVELFLKLRLFQEDPLLIYSNRKTGHTVGYHDAIKRLETASVLLDDHEICHIAAIRRTRNKIEHAELSISRDELDLYLVQAMRFLDEFLEDALGIELRDVIQDRERFNEFREKLYTTEERVKRAEEAAAEKTPWWEIKDGAQLEVVMCPECYSLAVAVGDGIEKPVCEFCGEQWDRTDDCPKCGKLIPGGLAEEEGICEDCWEFVMSGDD